MEPYLRVRSSKVFEAEPNKNYLFNHDKIHEMIPNENGNYLLIYKLITFQLTTIILVPLD